jgi:hypothetical protein
VLARSSQPASPPTDTPPKGCWVIDEGTEIRVVASSASLGRALISFLCFAIWAGGVGFIVSGLVHETIRSNGGTPPGWTPAWFPGSGPMPHAAVTVCWVVLTPFILGALVFLWIFLMYAAGRVEVTLRAGRGRLFTGVGPIGRTRHFDPSLVRNVSLRSKEHRDEDGNAIYLTEVVIEAEKPLWFGVTLSRPRQRFLLDALASVLPARGGPL